MGWAKKKRPKLGCVGINVGVYLLYDDEYRPGAF